MFKNHLSLKNQNEQVYIYWLHLQVPHLLQEAIKKDFTRIHQHGAGVYRYWSTLSNLSGFTTNQYCFYSLCIAAYTVYTSIITQLLTHSSYFSHSPLKSSPNQRYLPLPSGISYKQTISYFDRTNFLYPTNKWILPKCTKLSQNWKYYPTINHILVEAVVTNFSQIPVISPTIHWNLPQTSYISFNQVKYPTNQRYLAYFTSSELTLSIPQSSEYSRNAWYYPTIGPIIPQSSK